MNMRHYIKYNDRKQWVRWHRNIKMKLTSLICLFNEGFSNPINNSLLSNNRKSYLLIQVCMIMVFMVSEVLTQWCALHVYNSGYNSKLLVCSYQTVCLVFFALAAMRQWLLCMKNLLKKKAFHEYSKWITSVESYHVTHLVEIIWENLEDPVS